MNTYDVNWTHMGNDSYRFSRLSVFYIKYAYGAPSEPRRFESSNASEQFQDGDRIEAQVATAVRVVHDWNVDSLNRNLNTRYFVFDPNALSEAFEL
jgi:hypothetical protein